MKNKKSYILYVFVLHLVLNILFSLNIFNMYKGDYIGFFFTFTVNYLATIPIVLALLSVYALLSEKMIKTKSIQKTTSVSGYSGIGLILLYILSAVGVFSKSVILEYIYILLALLMVTILVCFFIDFRKVKHK